MTLGDWIDAALLVVGLAGAAGSLMGRRPFINEAQMETLIARFGRRTVRGVAAAGYLLLAVVGAVRLLGG
ncbi:MAG: hypothetical protein AAGU78_19085 [Chloroflexota bacterium]|jgi:hypothetical protein|nr:hypothetical protein [Anaerolineae bacterium]HMM29532.1 hypothetical protein [Aggregatilineaceae bacterium]